MVRDTLLTAFDARTPRAAIVAALAAERDKLANGQRDPWERAIAFLTSMPAMGRDAARAAIVTMLDAIEPAVPPAVASMAAAVGQPIDPAAGPAPLPPMPASEPIEIQVQGARGVVAAAADPEAIARMQAEQAAAAGALLAASKAKGSRGKAKPASVPPAPAAASASDPEPASEPAPDSKPAAGKANGEGEGEQNAQMEAARAAALAEAPKEPVNVYRDCVWARVRFRKLGNQRDASEEVKVTAATDGSDAKGQTSTTKRILTTCDQWRAIVAADAAFRLQLRALAVPTQLRGIYPITVAMMGEAEALIADYETRRAGMVKELVDKYPAAIEQDRGVLGPLWNASDYPPPAQVAASYRFAATWVDMSASARLSTAMAARNARAMADEQREAFAEVRAAMRVQVSSMLDDLIACLRPDDAGKRRRFDDSRVDKLRDWCLKFTKRDVTGDASLAATVGQIRSLLDGITDVGAVRASDVWRDDLAAKLETTRGALRTLGVTDAPSRVYRKRAAKPAPPAAPNKASS